MHMQNLPKLFLLSSDSLFESKNQPESIFIAPIQALSSGIIDSMDTTGTELDTQQIRQILLSTARLTKTSHRKVFHS